jgi:hypothetical protein
MTANHQKFPKLVDLDSISCMGLCGGDDFRCSRLKNGGLSAGKTGGSGLKRVDMLWRAKPAQRLGKCTTIADNNNILTDQISQ